MNNTFMKILFLNFLIIKEICTFYFYNFIRLLNQQPKILRLELIKNITYRLEEFNIIYVKIFQSLCLDKNLLYDEEKNYLIKYTDTVPYSSDDIDYNYIDKLESEYNIRLDSDLPINSGIVGVVFKGIHGNDNNNKVVIKILKNNIKENFEQIFNELEFIGNLFDYIPFIKRLKMKKFVDDNKELIKIQTDFKNESKNAEIYYNKFKNNESIIIPYVYKEITERYNNIIVMENIKGLTYSDIKNIDTETKNIIGREFMKFGMYSVLHYSAVHCDLHAGNIFFYINDEKTIKEKNVPKFQIGLIDFGLCCFPDRKFQNNYYLFLYECIYKNDFTNFCEIVSAFIENKDIIQKLNDTDKEMLKKRTQYCLKKYWATGARVLFELLNIFYDYNISFSKEFNHISLSLQTVSTLGQELNDDFLEVQNGLIVEFNNLQKMLEI